MPPESTDDRRKSARALDKAVRRTWHDWHAVALKARRDPGSRRLVHRFRIATRRLLAVEDLLATAPPGLPIREQLDTALRTAGRLRDLQICRAKLAELGDRYPVARVVTRSARKRLPILAQRLRRELRALKPRKMRQAVREMRARLHAANESTAARRARSRTLTNALRRHQEARRQLYRLARSLAPDTSDAALHSLRLRIKGVRYMNELVAALEAGDRRLAPGFETWQRALGAITDLRPVLREIDRYRAHRDAPQAALTQFRQYVLHTERRRIRALFGPSPPAHPRALRLRLLRTAPLLA